MTKRTFTKEQKQQLRYRLWLLRTIVKKEILVKRKPLLWTPLRKKPKKKWKLHRDWNFYFKYLNSKPWRAPQNTRFRIIKRKWTFKKMSVAKKYARLWFYGSFNQKQWTRYQRKILKSRTSYFLKYYFAFFEKRIDIFLLRCYFFFNLAESRGAIDHNLVSINQQIVSNYRYRINLYDTVRVHDYPFMTRIYFVKLLRNKKYKRVRIILGKKRLWRRRNFPKFAIVKYRTFSALIFKEPYIAGLNWVSFLNAKVFKYLCYNINSKY